MPWLQLAVERTVFKLQVLEADVLHRLLELMTGT